MKRSFLLSLLFLLSLGISSNIFGQKSNNSDAYTIITNPGENAAVEMRINWHTDVNMVDSYCIYTEAEDSHWAEARKEHPKKEICEVFDSIYSKNPAGENIYEEARFLRCTAQLKGLKPNTHYMYRVGSNNLSEVHYFKTAPASGNSSASGNTNIGIISDFHSYTPLPKRKEAAMDMIRTLERQNGKDLDFILHVGDVCAWGASYSFWKDLYSEEAFSKYMWAGVNGNHDNMDRKSKKLSNVYFKNVNNNPLNGYKGEKGVCYFFKYNNALFIMLNNEDMRTEEGLKEAQKWVRKVIKKNPARFTIVVEHYQWFYGNDGKTSQFNRWHELFEECGVDLAIAGNNHVYVRTDAINGTVYIQTPSSDNERGVEMKEWTDNKDIIKYRWSEGGNTVGALIMNFEENRIKVTLYDRNGVSLDEVRVE